MDKRKFEIDHVKYTHTATFKFCTFKKYYGA